MEKTNTDFKISDPLIAAMFETGAHYGYSKSRRHPSVGSYIFGVKNRVEIFDLEKTKDALAKAIEFVSGLSAARKVILFASSKVEAKESIRKAAEEAGLPYVASRWVGGTLTNFTQIKSRVERLINLRNQKQKGELSKYTKKEQLMIDREIARMEALFSGLVTLKEVPAALFIIDPKEETTAVSEAARLGIPVVALTGSDCDISKIDYPIPANDSARASVAFFVGEIARAYAEGNKLNDHEPFLRQVQVPQVHSGDIEA